MPRLASPGVCRLCGCAEDRPVREHAVAIWV